MLEVTEHDRVPDYSELAARLDGLRSRGARGAVDDAGARHSSLRHVMQLNPDFTKLGRSIVSGIDGDTAKRALVRAMLAFSTEMGYRLVAEGVERPEELETLREIGVDVGQGYLFPRPSPAMVASLDPGPVVARDVH